MGIYNNTKLVPVEEAYFGRTPEITKLFNQFCKFRGNYRSMMGKVFRYKVGINSDPELVMFNRMTEEVFGFKTFCLYILQSDNFDAFTLVPNRAKLKDPIIKNKNGFKFKKECECSSIVCMSTGCLFTKELTDEEIFAMIIHEIGHNFQDAMNGKMKGFRAFYDIHAVIFNLIQILKGDYSSLGSLLSGTLLKNNKIHSEIIRTFDGISSGISKTVIREILDYAFIIKSVINDIIINTINFAIALPMISYDIIGNLIQLIILYPSVQYNSMGEDLADLLPTMYGFGPALSSALLKTRYTSDPAFIYKIINHTPILGHIAYLVLSPLQLLSSLTDCHGSDEGRVTRIVKELNYEIEKEDMDPKMKKELIKQRDEAINSIENIHKELQKHPIKNPSIIINNICYFIYHLVGGDIRLVKTTFNKSGTQGEEVDKVLGVKESTSIFDKIKFN